MSAPIRRHPLGSGRTLVALVLVILAATASGCFRGYAEDSVRKMLPRLIGKADRYEVHIENTTDGQLMGGRVTDLSIVGRRVRIKDGPVVDRLEVHMHNLVVDTKKKAIKSVDRATFDLDFLQNDVARFLRQKLHTGDRLKVIFAPSAMTVVLPASLLGRSLDLSVRGSLATNGPTQVVFVPEGASIGSHHLPDSVTRPVLETLNPVADVKSLPVPARIDTVTMRPNVLNVKGRLYPRDDATPPTASPSPQASPSSLPNPQPTATTPLPGSPTPAASPSPAASPAPSPTARPSTPAPRRFWWFP